MPFSQLYLDRKVDNTVRAVNMGGEMSLILPHLYLGSLKDRTNSALMIKNKIHRVLCIIDVPDVIIDREEHKPKHILNIQAADATDQNLEQYFEKCIEFIHEARVEHENVLVHCHAGISRSATIVLAYLMTIGDYDVEKAIQIVKGARGYIYPNPGFLAQLRKYHLNDVKKAQKRLEKKFGSPLRTEDDLHMCEENQRTYDRMINEDILSNDGSNINVIEQSAPPIIEQIIDNNQEQKLKRILTIDDEKTLTNDTTDAESLSNDKISVGHSRTRRYQRSKSKHKSTRKTARRMNSMRMK